MNDNWWQQGSEPTQNFEDPIKECRRLLKYYTSDEYIKQQKEERDAIMREMAANTWAMMSDEAKVRELSKMYKNIKGNSNTAKHNRLMIGEILEPLLKKTNDGSLDYNMRDAEFTFQMISDKSIDPKISKKPKTCVPNQATRDRLRKKRKK